MPDFRERQVENRDKTRKMPNFRGVEGECLPFGLEW